MDNTILKASKGNRDSMNQLYESNKNQVYYVANALLRGSPSAIEAAKWAIISSLQSLSRGMIQTEKEFADYAIVQVANYCKKDITKKDSHAFRVPPKKNFRITSVDENVVKSAKRPCDYYFSSLPASQRFVFVLRLIGGMNEEQISDVVGLKVSIIDSIIEVEPDNLAKIYFTAKNNVEHCVPPTKELISSSIKEELSKISVPDVLDNKVEAYIDSVATPIEEAEKKKYQKRIFITIAAIICVVALILVLSSLNDDTNTDSTGTTETTVSDSGEEEDKIATDETEIEDETIVDEVCETAEPTDSNGSIASDEQPIITSITIRTEAAE